MEKEFPVSVILLTYNRENLLSSMIESILRQSFRDFEYIIVDNGSSDSSGMIAEEYAKKDYRIQVIHIEKSSIGKGRNVGLTYAKGRFVAFVDDDDICEMTYLEELYSCVKDTNDEIAICGTNKSSNNNSQTFSTKEAMEALLDRKCFNVGFPTKLIPRNFFEQDYFDETAKFDDIRLMPTMIAKAKKIHYIAKPLYIVNRHDNNNSAWTTNHSLLTKEILEEYLEVYEQRTKWLCQIFPEEESLWNYYKWSFYISMVQKITTLRIANCGKVNGLMKHELFTNRADFLSSNKIQKFEIEWMEEFIL